MRGVWRLLLPLPLLLAACGDLPRPFMGNPGATAQRLAVPPPPRLLVPAPADALLTDAASAQFADALAAALRAREVPAVRESPSRTDWRLTVRAVLRNDAVVPVFSVVDPTGKDQGTSEGAPVPASVWSAAAPATLKQSAQQGAPGVATLLTHIEAALMQADPNSLYNRAAHVMVAPVTGAPGDGNFSLTAQMRDKLSHLGPVVQDTPEGADFILRGNVRVVPIAGGQERVEIQWGMADAQGRDLGKVVQLNDIPAGTLNGFWGEVAVVVAQEAAAGIKTVIDRNSGHEQKPTSDAGKDAGTDAAPGAPAKTGPVPPPSIPPTARP